MFTLFERNDLIVTHMPYAEKLASIQFRKTPRSVRLDDLKSAAFMGLVQAANKYNGEVDFLCYSRWRIVGEMQDYLRSLYWAGRGNDVKVSSWDEAYESQADDEPENFDEFFDGITKNLSPLSKKILRMYYAEDLTIKQIAEEVNLSATRVFQLLKSSLTLIRESQESQSTT